MSILRKILTSLLGLGLLTACSSSEDHGLQTVDMPVQIAIPTGNIQSRAYGDPGTYETFQLPRYLYLFLVTKHIEGGITTTTVQRPLTSELLPSKWEKKLGSQTSFHVTGSDSLYVYTGDIHVLLPKERTEGEVYCAVSPVPLTLGNANPSTQADVQNLTFSFTSDASGSYDFLKDIYSSPYNLQLAGKYYGTVTDYASDYPRIDMVLYHVASRLDLDWNVAEAQQSKVRISSIIVSELKQDGCKLFRPMENTDAGTTPYSHTLNLNVGSQWYGRNYFYVIPYSKSGKFPISMVLLERDHPATPKAVAPDIPIASSSIFTPWMYGKISVSNGWDE